MDLALYCPDCGFYEKEEDNVGKRGHFFTSVSVGELFGQLLGFQFSDWFGGKDRTRNTQYEARNTPLKIVEAGAHNGQLARDILTWLHAHRPEIFHRLEYCIVEPSARRRDWQQATLKDFPGGVKWATEITELKSVLESSRTIIFSNELLDALPVHRLGWDAKEKKWFEWAVSLDGENFIWSRLPAAPNHVSRFNFHSELFDLLPDAYTIEISPAAEEWWRSAADVFADGKLLTFDYGFTTDEQFSPERVNGTLRAYHRHQVTDNLLANAGEQDLTAHVNFSAIQVAGESAGLRTEIFCTQSQFLTRIVEKIFRQPESFGEWGQKQTRQFQTLTHPDHLGRAFSVLVQSR
ncbi:MAG TPA: SAM-dependent methyltransferase [Verrucomicrobiae bacterium]|nr:SAM-dependent methyltransferase [Verrucomicrobiae bacterium]